MPGAHTLSDHVGDPSQVFRVGRIKSVDLATARCVVEIDDGEGEEVETAEIQWGMLRCGATRIWSPPSEGEQVLLLCPGGDIAQAVPFGALASDEFPPAGDSTRELIEFADGAVFAYDPEAQRLDITLPPGATTRIESDGGVEIKGDVAIEGDLTLTGTATADVDVIADGVSLKHHTHPGVQAGGAHTGQPE